MSIIEDIEMYITKIQPFYTDLNHKYSRSYLNGSLWYVGDDLRVWWLGLNNIRYFDVNIRKLRFIVYIIMLDLQNSMKQILV